MKVARTNVGDAAVAQFVVLVSSTGDDDDDEEEVSGAPDKKPTRCFPKHMKIGRQIMAHAKQIAVIVATAINPAR